MSTKKVKVVIPEEEFRAVLVQLSRPGNECGYIGCPYVRARCYLRLTHKACRDWWKTTNGDAPGFACYEALFTAALRSGSHPIYELFENWAFREFSTEHLATEVHKLIALEARSAFAGKS